MKLSLDQQRAILGRHHMQIKLPALVMVTRLTSWPMLCSKYPLIKNKNAHSQIYRFKKIEQNYFIYWQSWCTVLERKSWSLFQQHNINVIKAFGNIKFSIVSEHLASSKAQYLRMWLTRLFSLNSAKLIQSLLCISI